MTICPTCNENNSDHWIFCATCGEELLAQSDFVGAQEPIAAARQPSGIPGASPENFSEELMRPPDAGLAQPPFPGDMPNRQVGLASPPRASAPLVGTGTMPAESAQRRVAPFPDDVLENQEGQTNSPLAARNGSLGSRVGGPVSAPLGGRRQAAPFPDDVIDDKGPRFPEQDRRQSTPPRRPMAPFPDDLGNSPSREPVPCSAPLREETIPKPKPISKSSSSAVGPTSSRPNLDAIAKKAVSVTQSIIIKADNPSQPPAARAQSSGGVCQMCGFDLQPEQAYCQECGMAVKKPDSTPPR